MKRILLFGLLLIIGASVFARRDKSSEEARVMSAVEARRFKVDVAAAYPMGGRVVHLSGSYSLALKNDTVEACLPYFGRAYSVPYGGGEGLNFSVRGTDFSRKMKKGSCVLTFSARTDEDNYRFTVSVSPDGASHVTATMTRRQSISFTGWVDKESLLSSLSD